MSMEQFRLLRTRLHLEDLVPEDALADDREPPYISLPEDSEVRQYMLQRRQALDGSLPRRSTRTKRPLELPADAAFEEVLGGSGKQAASTTTAFTRLLRNLCRDPKFGPRVVPIIPDEARTFGMDSLFKQFGIYASKGQQYEPVDHDLLLSYTESQSGQILEEGITEAGSLASFIAAGTSYSTHGVPMVPFFTFYSMFGFQRVGDLIWQATDARTRGFLLGATAGRTTLLGEGLQHQDGHSLLLASVNPVIEAYDPAFAYEVATIVQDGLRRMYGEGEDVLYYLTLYNENQLMPARPEGAAAGVVEGLYRWAEAPAGTKHAASVLFSGSANLAAREAQAELAEHYDVGVDLHSATSYKRLREQALSTERWNRLHADEPARTPRVTELLAGEGPVVAVTDFMKAIPDQVARWVPAGRSFTPLGTDGFGRSDTREALRRHFEIDGAHVVVATLAALAAAGEIKPEAVKDAIERYGVDPEAVDPRLA
jgi:pyruvate dehydrogenase E1 component